MKAQNCAHIPKMGTLGILWGVKYMISRKGEGAMREVKICPKCGKVNDRDFFVCSKCGMPLEDAKVVDAEAAKNAEVQNPEEAYCIHCGNKVSRLASICHKCGCNPLHITTGSIQKFCSECGQEIMPGAIVCTSCGCNTKIGENPNDKSSGGLNALAIFLPLVGLILYIVYHSNYPKKANAIGKWLLIGIIARFFLAIILGMISGY